MTKSYRLKESELSFQAAGNGGGAGSATTNMVRKFGKVISFPGSHKGSLDPAMLSLHFEPAAATAAGLDDDNEDKDNAANSLLSNKYSLAERLATAQTALRAKERTLRRLRQEQEAQLAVLCRQMMSFECGLRRKQRELSVAIQQRDRIIREQASVIKFLSEKNAANKKRNISDLKSEAMAKIPQVVELEDEVKSPLHLTTIRVTGDASPDQLTSILESHSENDSDSAIILDDSLASTLSSVVSEASSGHLRRISRSVSDVMSASLVSESPSCGASPAGGAGAVAGAAAAGKAGSAGSAGSSDEGSKSSGSLSDPEDSQPCSFDSTHYRGFLLRHGSYERYKVRSLRIKRPQEAQAAHAVSSRGLLLHHHNDLSCSSSSSTCSSSSAPTTPALPTINHRNVTKPRDIKNRNNRANKGSPLVTLPIVPAKGLYRSPAFSSADDSDPLPKELAEPAKQQQQQQQSA